MKSVLLKHAGLLSGSRTVALSTVRGKYFGPVDIRDGVAVIRIDGPGKMNTIDDDFRQEFEDLWEVSVVLSDTVCRWPIDKRGWVKLVLFPQYVLSRKTWPRTRR
jgi:hypothetical protein